MMVQSECGCGGQVVCHTSNDAAQVECMGCYRKGPLAERQAGQGMVEVHERAVDLWNKMVEKDKGNDDGGE